MEMPDRAEIVAKFRRVSDSKRLRADRKLLRWTPAQWNQFERQPPHGQVLGTARILPVRVPLSSLYEMHLSKDTTNYSPSSLIESLISRARGSEVVNVGLVIDATGDDVERHNTREWDDWDVEYFKLPLQEAAGGGDDDGDGDGDGEQGALTEAHEDVMVEAFFAAMVKHRQGFNKDREVAVFGAKGYAFVGYLIVSFLVEYCGRALDQAMKDFAESCPPGIYCRKYVERLYKKYFSTLGNPTMRLTIPTSPGWDPLDENESQPQDIGVEVLTEEDKMRTFVPKALDFPMSQPRNGTSSSPSAATSGATTPGGSQKPRFPTPRAYKPPVYTPPPPPPPPPSATALAKRRKIRTWEDEVEPLQFGELIDTSSDTHKTLTEMLEKMTKVTGFPGCEAISLTATHVGDKAFTRKGCLTKQYLVTWRARGRRCLLWILKDATYLISRDKSFTKIEMHFPRKHAPTETLTNTLLDGILVTDRDGKVDVKRYLVFDIVFFEGKDIWQRKLEKRLSCIQNEIMQPKKQQDLKTHPVDEPFRVRMKDHFRLAKTEYLLDKFVKSVTHQVDGVIYTPTDAPYNLGGFESDEPIFKFVATEGDMPSFDGTLSKRKLLEYLSAMP